MSRFIKFIPSDETSYLRKKHPNAFLLLSLIAERARRISNQPDGLEIGEAHIGDYEEAGIETERQYRTAKDILVMRGHIKISETCRTRKKSTTGTTTRGTLVKLLNSGVWDINPERCDDRNVDRPTTDRRPTDDEQERIRKNNKEEEEEHTHGLRAVGCDVVIPIDFGRNLYQPDNRVLNPPTFQKRRPEPEPEPEEKKKSYGADETVMLTEHQYEDLLNHMSEKERDYWIDEVTLDIGKKGEREFNKRYNSHYHTILSWKRIREERKAMFNSRQASIFSVRTPEENRELAEGVEKTQESKYYTITILSQGVEFTPKFGNCQPDFIAYNAHGFKDQFGNALMKKNFVNKRIL